MGLFATIPPRFRRDCGCDCLRSTARRLAGNWRDMCRYNLFKCPVQPGKNVAKKAHYCPDFLSRVGAFRRRLRISEASHLVNGKLRFGYRFAGCGPDNCIRMLEDESIPKKTRATASERRNRVRTNVAKA